MVTYGIGVGIGCGVSAFFIGQGLITREWRIVSILLWALYAFLCFIHVQGDRLCSLLL